MSSSLWAASSSNHLVGLRGSAVFRRLVADAAGVDDTARPIKLPDLVKPVDFERFLDILYPLVFGQYTLSSPSEWISVLRVAHYFRFDSVKALAKDQLVINIRPIDKIVCSREFNLPEWLKDACLDLCYRQDSLTVEEAMLAGLPFFTKIAAARERIRSDARLLPHHEAVAIIDRMFAPDDTTPAASPSNDMDVITQPAKKGRRKLKGRSEPVPEPEPVADAPVPSPSLDPLACAPVSDPFTGAPVLQAIQ
ncbi:hypothetical protein PUNSTDRAFT_121773 [Punctularia strigosozonata HHB-11173 SS5]|uniref:uncharacterized protein n=1 Tax=Punctularia strigosozonata (strain HHB-11173) TaxID=741275 RepID=UPI0004418280|nr:uncharacterized protein PUNSTDRAFT_121773 [Punctularia strigosozonata HHB-11173 SS5]EIN06623.1 hypothetical protein PUNSTDRAFT_121773 [Punctularia strigosozonata HHB-11173 SS5]